VKAAESPGRLAAVVDQIAALLEKHRVLETWTHNQTVRQRQVLESLVHRQNLVELQQKVRALSAPDLGYVLEALSPADRRVVWEQLGATQAGGVLVEVSRALREELLGETPPSTLRAMLTQMDEDDLAFVSESLGEDLREEVDRARDAADRSATAAVAYPDDSVGRLMGHDLIAVRDERTVAEAVAQIRARRALPRHLDAIFIVDARNVLRGTVPMRALLVHDPEEPVVDLMDADALRFRASDAADAAAETFRQHDLVCAPVVDERGKLIGALTVDVVLDFVGARAEIRALQSAGLRGEEDLLAPVWHSARNRWLWLFTNLVTAFLASRVIGLFEESIERLVALAALMPIVASVGGNTGNQTVALMIRGLALGQVTRANVRRLVLKELTVSLLNGVVWGGLMGLFAVALYGSPSLGLVMATAILLNLLAAALVGVAVPMALHGMGRDPAHGSSVLLTFATDGLGFFIFLGLAQAFLLR
jgi:magnesium transporter